MMKLIRLLALLAYTFSATAQQPGSRWGDQGDGTFRNPVLWADYSDPDPLRVGDDYYLVASTFESYPGVSILHSMDLVNWETIGAAFHHLPTVSADYSWQRMNRYNGGVYAPTISYHDGRYYIYANLYTDGFYMASAERPEGPWTEQMLTDKYGRPLRVLHWTDPCPFWDDDGKAYLAASHPGREFWYSYLFQMSPDGTQLLDADSAHIAQMPYLYQYPDGGTCISPYHSSEGNRIFKHDGYYYLQHIEFTDRGLGEGTYIFRSRHLYGTHPDGTAGRSGNPGEYEKYCVERVTDRNKMRLPGQGGYVTTPDGRWWWIGQFTRDYPEGRLPHLLPVTWRDGWPHIGDSEGRTPMQLTKPIQGFDQTLPQGSDDFSAPTLHPRWAWNHSSRDSHWSLTERRGWLRLHAFQPHGRRGFFGAGNTLCQHTMRSDSTVITTRMDIRHLADSTQAGLAIFNGGKSYANIGIQGGRIRYDENGQAITGPPFPRRTKYIFLRAVIDREAKATFQYSLDDRTYTPLGTAYQLVAGNFRGAMVGLFCYDEQAGKGYVDFDYFDYKLKH